jgi:hypothetical protein
MPNGGSGSAEQAAASDIKSCQRCYEVVIRRVLAVNLAAPKSNNTGLFKGATASTLNDRLS